MTARGSGFANLPTDSIHYRADIKFDNIPEIPVQISGKLASPSYAVDMQRFLGKSAQELTDTLLNQGKDGESNPLKLLEKGLKKPVQLIQATLKALNRLCKFPHLSPGNTIRTSHTTETGHGNSSMPRFTVSSNYTLLHR